MRRNGRNGRNAWFRLTTGDRAAKCLAVYVPRTPDAFHVRYPVQKDRDWIVK
jgi:hypothetical protein